MKRTKAGARIWVHKVSDKLHRVDGPSGNKWHGDESDWNLYGIPLTKQEHEEHAIQLHTIAEEGTEVDLDNYIGFIICKHTSE